MRLYHYWKNHSLFIVVLGTIILLLWSNDIEVLLFLIKHLRFLVMFHHLQIFALNIVTIIKFVMAFSLEK